MSSCNMAFLSIIKRISRNCSRRVAANCNKHLHADWLKNNIRSLYGQKNVYTWEDRIASFHTHRWVPWNLRPAFIFFKLITHEPEEILASDDSTNMSGLCWSSDSSTYPKQKSRFSREALTMVDKDVYLAVWGGIIYHNQQPKQE